MRTTDDRQEPQICHESMFIDEQFEGPDGDFEFEPLGLTTQPLGEHAPEMERSLEQAQESVVNGRVPLNLDGSLIGNDPYESGLLPKIPRALPHARSIYAASANTFNHLPMLRAPQSSRGEHKFSDNAGFVS